MESKWTQSVLTIEAPLPKLAEGVKAAKPKEIPIKIQHRGELPKGAEKKEKCELPKADEKKEKISQK
jgi:hypothetical protein